MLDENLPTFRVQPCSDSPLDALLYLTHNGSDPAPEYLLRRAASRGTPYALGLLDAHHPSVVYAEVLISPAAPAPASAPAPAPASASAAPAPAPAAPAVPPEAFDVLLYNPDAVVTVRHHPGGWGRSESWEFEVPERSFKPPSASQLDRDEAPLRRDLEPRVVFRWKRDGRLSRDMTCCMAGRSAGGRRSREPDITVALLRDGGRGGAGACAVTLYEPNMARVEVQDRKGLEVVLLLIAGAVRDVYLGARPDAPAAAAAAAAAAAEEKKEGEEEEEEEEKKRQRDRRDRAEQERIREMLRDEEERERRRREADVERETERLRRQYGVQASPPLPPRPGASQSQQQQQHHHHHHQHQQHQHQQHQHQHYYASGALGGAPPAKPPRPSSVGPAPPADGPGRKKLSRPLGQLPALGGFFHRPDGPSRTVVRKKSV
ncbi:uncharacterized protein UV8b_07860 [Ustilaginoidea virens]|uniref:Uncharacterized protein n=1 Tax=Ustilaginoidea virens TaxID=1159556 RepID=A0A8E5HXW1_USTVR|nr:uncharacterized protein UV8b_07860 [Ustilaginoidea virens]QUC23619.1 hypothetical protein UV8b_07860 [Ustilaginoidea virens]